MRFLALLLLACTCSAVLIAGDFADISVTDLTKAIADKTVTLIDVNGSESWKAGHIPGAIDLAGVGAGLAAQLPADKAALVVAYCGGPACGAWKRGAEAAAALGYTNVKHFKGGIRGWTASNAKLETVAAKGCSSCDSCGK